MNTTQQSTPLTIIFKQQKFRDEGRTSITIVSQLSKRQIMAKSYLAVYLNKLEVSRDAPVVQANRVCENPPCFFRVHERGGSYGADEFKTRDEAYKAIDACATKLGVVIEIEDKAITSAS
jgi:hypothetical protein